MQNDDGRSWNCTVGIQGRKVEFSIGGSKTPDPVLVSWARQIVTGFSNIQCLVQAYLERQAMAFPGQPDIADEIRSLHIESVMLAWPDRPRHGMFFFAGSSDERLWHCDYVDNEVRDLACDT